MLVTAGELGRHVQQDGWVVVDCRFNLARPEAGEAAYREGHVPGAWYAHLDRDLSAPRSADSGRHPLPSPADLVRLFSGWGIGPGVRVVAYDDAGGAIAARLWWLLRWMGHGEVALLDGGLPAWRAAGLPLSTQLPTPRAARFAGQPGHMPVVTSELVERRLADPGFRLADARAPARFQGREEPIDPVAGHVPGAINLPFQDSLAADGHFRAPAELRRAFEPLAAAAARGDAAVMCGSGVTACHTLFAMELAGLKGASLYAGSWSEWIRAPSRPVVRESGPAHGGG